MSEKENLRREAMDRLEEMVEGEAQSFGQGASELLQELRIHQIELEMQNQELREVQVSLEKAKVRYIALFDEAPVAYFVFNGKGQAVEINYSAANLLKIDRHHIEVRPFFFYLDQGCREAFFRHLRTVLEEGKQDTLEVLLHTSEGEERNVLMISRPIAEQEGEPAYSLTTCFDITVLKKTENLLRVALEKSESASTAKDEFLGTMSHEFRTPLNSILGFADMLSFSELGENEKGFLEQIKGGGRQMVALVDDVLDIARLAADKIKIVHEPCNIEELVAAALEHLEKTAQRKGVAIEQSIDCPMVFTDASRVRQVVINLLSNAIKFTKEGKVSVSVFSEEEGEKMKVTIRVRDTGVGIRPEDMEKIFEPFTQGDSSICRSYEGSGLGLTIAKRLANRLGGDIYLRSEIGVGTEAVFFFTANRWQEAAKERVVVMGEKEEFSHFKFLLLDSVTDGIGLIESQLLRLTPYVTSAKGVDSAVKEIREGGYTHVFINVAIPRVDAVECMIRMRKSIAKPALFIALSPRSAGEDREDYLAAGFDDCIVMPLSLAGLRACVNFE